MSTEIEDVKGDPAKHLVVLEGAKGQNEGVDDFRGTSEVGADCQRRWAASASGTGVSREDSELSQILWEEGQVS